jgi:hypothetical protein
MLSPLLARFSKPQDGATFRVDDVAQAEKALWTERLQDQLGRRFQRKILILPDADRPVANASVSSLPEAMRANLGARLSVNRCHPLIDTIHTAFSQHRPLVLSPDAIWLVIAQGFGHHVTAHAEELRGRLVRHQGSRALTANVEDWSVAGFQQAIACFSAQIREATDPVLHETLICDFSNTTPETRTASEVALMDTYASYFTYRIGCICGIPRITLTGSPADWERIRARVEVLETLGLAWWIPRLRPILDEFVLAANGHPTAAFWKAIYKPAQAYGDSVVTGWITDLFPYLGDAPQRVRNHVFEHARIDWALPVANGVETRKSMFGPSKGVRTKSFPSGLSRVPVKLSFPNGSEYDADLLGGFFAVEQNPVDRALSPHMSWCLTVPPPETPVRV